MKKEKIFIYFIFALIFCLLTPFHAFALGNLWGHVEDVNGNNIENPLITVRQSNGSIKRTTGMANGDYIVYDLVPGLATVSVAVSGFLVESDTVEIPEDGSYVAQHFTLKEPLTIESSTPNWGEVNHSQNVTIQGTGFDGNSKVSMYLDLGNKKNLLSLIEIPGVPDDFVIVDDIAYVTGYTINDSHVVTFRGVWLIDLSTPELLEKDGPNSGRIINQIATSGETQGIDVVDGFAYVATGDEGLRIYNVTNPATPSYVGGYDPSGNVRDVVVQNNTAYLAADTDGLIMLNVTSPASTNYKGAYITAEPAKELTVVDNMAFVATGDGGLQLIDVSSVTSPFWRGQYNHTAYGVTVLGDVAYVRTGDNGLHLVNISNPLMPVFYGKVDGLENILGQVAVQDEVGDITAFVSSESGGLHLINVTNPSALDEFGNNVDRIIGSVDTPNSTSAVQVINSTAYILEYGGLRLINIDEQVDVAVSSQIEGSGNDVRIVGTIAYMSAGTEGLKVIDMTDPANPNLYGTIATPNTAGKIAIYGNTAYVVSSSGLQTIDVSNPGSLDPIGSNPGRLLDFYTSPGNAQRVAVAGDIAYVADSFKGLLLLNVSNPSNIWKYGEILTPGSAYGVAVNGDYAYVADASSGLQIVDVENPHLLDYSGTNTDRIVSSGVVSFTPHDAYDVIVNGTLAYVAASNGLHIIDVTNHLSPYRIGMVETPDIAIGVNIVGERAYMACYRSGLQLIDVSDPFSLVNPGSNTDRIIGSVNTPSYANSVGVAGSTTACVADSYAGLVMVPLPSEVGVTAFTDSQLTVTLPATGLAGHYIIRVYNGNESAELLGGMTISPAKPNSKAIVVAAYGDGVDYSAEIRSLAEEAYKSLVWQGFNPANTPVNASEKTLYYLTPEAFTDINKDGFNDRDDDTTTAALSAAINIWAADADDLVIYLIGHGGFDTFNIKGNVDIIDASTLAGWINSLQATEIDGRVVIIYEACKSGSFVKSLKVPTGLDYERVLITSSTPNQDSNLNNDGLASFSHHFWDSIEFYKGDIVQAFRQGYNAVESTQTPWMDTNRDAVPNTSEDILTDRTLGREVYTGAGESPIIITEVYGSEVLVGVNTTTLWAWVESDIDPADIILKAEIIPPDFDSSEPGSLGSLPMLTMTYNATNNRWEVTYSSFSVPGTYKITYLASSDQIVEPYISYHHSTVVRSFAGADTYEPDNLADQANSVVINKQQGQHHSIHIAGDIDWLKFYGLAGTRYELEAFNLAPDMDAVLELYHIDDLVTPLAVQDTVGDPLIDETITFDCLLDGIYYVKVRHADPSQSGPGTMYDFRVVTPSLADFPSFSSVTGMITSGSVALYNAVIRAVQVNTPEPYITTGISSAGGDYAMDLPDGTYDVTVDAEGYLRKTVEDVVVAGGGNIPISMTTLLPGDMDGNDQVTLDDAIIVLQVLAGMTPAAPFKLTNDVDENSQAGFAEVVYILQTLATQ